MAINFNSYDTLGKSGLSLMQQSWDKANGIAASLADSTDPMDIAQASMDMSQAKVQMAVGAFLVKSQNDLVESTLKILDPEPPLKPYGVGLKHDRRY